MWTPGHLRVYGKQRQTRGPEFRRISALRPKLEDPELSLGLRCRSDHLGYFSLQTIRALSKS